MSCEACQLDQCSCAPGTCGETHAHCTDCGALVDIEVQRRCTLCEPGRIVGVAGARCQSCALDHYLDVHRGELLSCR